MGAGGILECFNEFVLQLQQMGKRIKKLEKEGAQWRAKWENSNRALLDMAEEVRIISLFYHSQLCVWLIVHLFCCCVWWCFFYHVKKDNMPSNMKKRVFYSSVILTFQALTYYVRKVKIF